MLLAGDNGTFEHQSTISSEAGSEPYWFVADDFSGSEGNVGVLFGYRNASFGRQNAFSTGNQSSPTTLALPDVNEDGYLDIVVASYIRYTIGVSFGRHPGTFWTYTVVSSGNTHNPNFVTIADLDGDHHVDIIVTKADTSTVGVLVGNGSGVFLPQSNHLVAIASRPKSVLLVISMLTATWILLSVMLT